MPTWCCTLGCKNNSSTGYTLFEFPPLSQPQVRKEWVAAVSSNRMAWELKKSHRLCEVHFTSSDIFAVGQHKFLRKGVVPQHFCRCQDTWDVEKINQTHVDHGYSSARIDEQNENGPEGCKTASRKQIHEDHMYCSSRKALGEINGNIQAVSKKAARRNLNYETCVVEISKKSKTFQSMSHLENCPSRKKPLKSDECQRQYSDEGNPANAPATITSQSSCTEKENTPPRTLPSISACQNQENDTQGRTDPHLPQPSLSVRTKKRKLEEHILEKQLKEAQEENIYLKKQIGELAEKLNSSQQHLNEDQRRVLERGCSRGAKWSEDSVLKGIAIRSSCGTSGYKYISENVAPLPSVRTLQRRTEKIITDPGVLDEVFAVLEKTVPKMDEKDQYCALCFDEMAIEPRVDYDRNTQSYIGYATLPGCAKEKASKAVVFQLKGLRKRWKQIIAYHFIPSTANPEGMKTVIRDILERCEKVGLKLLVIVCDMGNRNVLNALGFSCKKDLIIFRIPHPFNPSRYLFALPDGIHVFKSTKEMLVTNETCVLPDDVIQANNLPSNVVDMKHVYWLENYQSDMDVKFAPKMKPETIRPKHFAKMRVPTATSVIDYLPAAALMYLALQGIFPAAVMTTSWFISLLRSWFVLLTARTQRNALSKKNEQAHDRAIAVIKMVKHLFQTMKVGNSWKVTQTHVIMLCETILQIQDYLLNGCGFQFVCLGRFLQDSLENIFSCIRMTRPRPSALDFKYRLKALLLGNCVTEIRGSSYQFDDSVDLLNLMSFTSILESDQRENLELPAPYECNELPEKEVQVFYRMCGYVIFKLKPSIELQCKSCYESLLMPEGTDCENSFFVKCSDFAEYAQVRVSNEIFELFKSSEEVLRSIQSNLKDLKKIQQKVTDHLVKVTSHLPISTCHDLRKDLVYRFVKMRLPQLSATLTKLEKVKSSVFSSRSTGSGELADNFNPVKSK